MLASLRVDSIGHVPLVNQRDGFGPGKRGSFAVGEERRLAPGVERVETLLGLARCSGVFRVHIEAESAAIDLGRAHLYEFEKRWFQVRRLTDVHLQIVHGAVRTGYRFRRVKTGIHSFRILRDGLASATTR